MEGPAYVQIARVDRPPVEEFRRLYDESMKPIVITGALSDWRAVSEWSHDWFKQKYGLKVVGLSANPRHTQRVLQMKLGDYIDCIQSGADGLLYMDQQPVDGFRGLSDYYETPVYCHPQRRIDVSLWVGPADTVLGFHKDNHHPYDWINNIFVQIRGRKRIVLASPEQDPFMYQRVSEGTDYWHSYIYDPGNVDFSRYPQFREATLLEAIVHPGEILFIPGNYWHYVRALDKSISLSFWWRRHRISDLINRLLAKDPAERAAFLESHTSSVTADDVEEFGGIARLADALALLRERSRDVVDLFDSDVRASLGYR